MAQALNKASSDARQPLSIAGGEVAVQELCRLADMHTSFLTEEWDRTTEYTPDDGCLIWQCCRPET